jgi:hypothetical protein
MNIPPGFAQVNMLFGGDALPRKAQVVFGVEPDPTKDTVLEVATGVVNAWEAVNSIRSQTDDNVVLEGIRVKFGPNATGLDGTIGYSKAGSFATAGVTPQVAILVRKNTALGGRSNKGRMFLPGLGEAAVEASGQIITSSLTNWQTAVDIFLAGLGTELVPMVLLHNATEQAPTPVTSLSVQSLVASQRRRIRRVGGRRSATP